jgi:hypothetical protein
LQDLANIGVFVGLNPGNSSGKFSNCRDAASDCFPLWMLAKKAMPKTYGMGTVSRMLLKVIADVSDALLGAATRWIGQT